MKLVASNMTDLFRDLHTLFLNHFRSVYIHHFHLNVIIIFFTYTIADVLPRPGPTKIIISGSLDNSIDSISISFFENISSDYNI